MGEHLVWPYWSVDLPGLRRADARRILVWAETEEASLGGIAVDPMLSYSAHLDGATVEAMTEALNVALESNSLRPEQSEIARSLCDQLTDWLSTRPGSLGSG
jgi:hypothetical protein